MTTFFVEAHTCLQRMRKHKIAARLSHFMHDQARGGPEVFIIETHKKGFQSLRVKLFLATITYGLFIGGIFFLFFRAARKLP